MGIDDRPAATRLRKTGALRGLRTLAKLALCCASISGCDPVPDNPAPPVQTIAASAVLNEQSETLTPAEMQAVSATSAGAPYVLGPNDVISVTVYMHPDVSVPAPDNTGNVGGVLVTSDGSVQLPLIGNIHLGGLTLDEARQAITTAYAAYLTSPQVAVELVQAQSLSYYLLGAFTAPGVKYPLHQLDLLDALALGGSVDIANADLYQAYVAQGAVKLPVDLHALLVDGDLSQNILLKSGDAIVVPSSASENAFVFGAVGKPGAVPFQSGALSLLQALSVADLDLPNYTDARLSRIHVIRAHGRSASFMIIDARAIMDGEALPFALLPGDIVFVPPTEVATWNQVLTQLLPSLQTVSDVLNPFVSIKYLKQ